MLSHRCVDLNSRLSERHIPFLSVDKMLFCVGGGGEIEEKWQKLQLMHTYSEVSPTIFKVAYSQESAHRFAAQMTLIGELVKRKKERPFKERSNTRSPPVFCANKSGINKLMAAVLDIIDSQKNEVVEWTVLLQTAGWLPYTVFECSPISAHCK